MEDKVLRGNGRIHVGRLPMDIKEDELRSVFNRFGDIKRIDLKYGYAFLFYEDEKQAQLSVDESKDTEIRGNKITVETAFTDKEIPYKAPPVVKQELRLAILDIDDRCNWKDLKDWGRKAGGVHYTATHTRNGVPIGVIEYETAEDFENALKVLPNEPLYGRNVRVVKDDPDDGPYDPEPVKKKFDYRNYGPRDRNAQYIRGDREFDRGRMSRDFDRRDYNNGGRNNYNESYDRGGYDRGMSRDFDRRDYNNNGGRNNFNESYDRGGFNRRDYNNGGRNNFNESYDRGGYDRRDFNGGRNNYNESYDRGGNDRREYNGARNNFNESFDRGGYQRGYERARSRSRERNFGGQQQRY